MKYQNVKLSNYIFIVRPWRNCIIDKNAKIGKDVMIMNKDVSITTHGYPLFDGYIHLFLWFLNKFVSGQTIQWSEICIFNLTTHLNVVAVQGVQEADRPDEGFYIREGIVIVVEKALIEDGKVI